MKFDINDLNSPNPGSRSSLSHFGSLGDRNSSHPAVILKRTLYEGNVKIYEDAKGIAERCEISLPEGKIVVYKDYEVSEKLAKYKRIDILSLEDNLKGTIDIIPRDRTSPRPGYRFFYERSEIGSGSGDIAIYIAQKFLGESLGSRSAIGTEVDEEVISTIKSVLQSKAI